MGLSSRLFICDEADLVLLRSGERHADDFEGTDQMKGVTSLHLCVAWAAIEGQDWDPETHAGTMLMDEEPWLEHFSRSMVAAFAALKDTDAQRIASALAPTEDFEWKPAELLDVLALVRGVAQRAGTRELCLITEL